ncbi:YegP family protein [Natrononativus amylolyticus]|uniref:YegP family protein n=1 Tax=Natrononativus amylolyticus TaxID=2963434 RepID=UPI0020CC1C67|nr:amphi-Trp domain-containing protein [Natrononativus amylolyticus]
MADEHTLFELEATHDRAELAALLAELSTALETGRPARLAVDDRTASISFPDRIEVDLEAETTAGSPGETELELELEWAEPAADSSVRVDEGPGVDESAETADATPDAAAAAMPAESTTAGREARASGERTARFEVYRDRAEEWRWRLVHWNGNIVADSGEGYVSRYNATRAARSVSKSAATARIEQVEE